LAALEKEAGFPLPDDLAELYREMDGGRFAGGVTLFSVRPSGGIPGIIESLADLPKALPKGRIWYIGRRGESGHLLSGQKSAFASSKLAQEPLWFTEAPANSWVFAMGRADGEVAVFPSLEQLLGAVVPPVATEAIGETTFNEALSAVAGAMEELSDPPKKKK
jgi:hypothetical protein